MQESVKTRKKRYETKQLLPISYNSLLIYRIYKNKQYWQLIGEGEKLRSNISSLIEVSTFVIHQHFNGKEPPIFPIAS